MRRALSLGLAPPRPEEESSSSSSGLLAGGLILLVTIGIFYDTLNQGHAR